MRAVDDSGQNLGAGVALAVIDADAATCLAYEFTKDSRSAIAARKAKGIVEVVVKELNKHCRLYLSRRHFPAPGLSDREWRMKMVWERCDDGTYFLTYEDTNELDDEFPVETGSVVASSRAAYLFEPLPKVGNIPQTRVTYVGRVDMKGSIPRFIMNKLTLRTGKNVSLLQNRFNRCDEIDTASRSAITKEIKLGSVLKSVAGNDTFAKRFVKKDGMVRYDGAFPPSDSWLKYEQSGKGSGMTSFIVAATLEETAAFFLDFDSRSNKNATGDLERLVLEKRRELEVVVKRRYFIKDGKQRHEINYVSCASIQIVDRDTIVIIMEPCGEVHDAEEDYEFSKCLSHDAVLAKEITAIRFKRRSQVETSVEFVTELDLEIKIGRNATMSMVKKHLDEATEVQRYFAYNVELQDMTNEIGEALGHDMVWEGGNLGRKYTRHNHNEHVKQIISMSKVRIDENSLDKLSLDKLHSLCSIIITNSELHHSYLNAFHKALNAIAKEYPWFIILMQRVRAAAVAKNRPVLTQLNRLRESEARVIGNNLMPALKSRKTAQASVEQWSVENRAAEELLIKYPWMKALFVAVGKGVVKAAPWGMMWR